MSRRLSHTQDRAGAVGTEALWPHRADSALFHKKPAHSALRTSERAHKLLRSPVKGPGTQSHLSGQSGPSPSSQGPGSHSQVGPGGFETQPRRPPRGGADGTAAGVSAVLLEAWEGAEAAAGTLREHSSSERRLQPRPVTPATKLMVKGLQTYRGHPPDRDRLGIHANQASSLPPAALPPPLGGAHRRRMPPDSAPPQGAVGLHETLLLLPSRFTATRVSRGRAVAEASTSLNTLDHHPQLELVTQSQLHKQVLRNQPYFGTCSRRPHWSLCRHSTDPGSKAEHWPFCRRACSAKPVWAAGGRRLQQAQGSIPSRGSTPPREAAASQGSRAGHPGDGAHAGRALATPGPRGAGGAVQSTDEANHKASQE